VLKVIQGQHNKPKAAVHTAEMTGPLKKKKNKDQTPAIISGEKTLFRKYSYVLIFSNLIWLIVTRYLILPLKKTCLLLTVIYRLV
jgi:hypothetical protein